MLTGLCTLSSNLGALVAAHTYSNQPFSRSQHQTWFGIMSGISISRQGCGHQGLLVRSMYSSGSSSSSIEDLRQLHFTDEQAARLLLSLSLKKKAANIGNIRLWLQLLHRYDVEQPTEVISGNSILLCNLAENSADNAAAVVQWLTSMGFTSSEVAKILSRGPMLLTVPHATSAAAAAWFLSELHWDSGMIAKMIAKHAQLFGLSAEDSLAPKLAWFVMKGFRKEKLGRVFFTNPQLLDFSIQRNNIQLSALQALGLTETQVLCMVHQVPALLKLNIAGLNIQAKVRFLTQVMGKQIQEICLCPNFLSCSLLDMIGPRWSFHTRYYHPGQPFKLSTKYKSSDEDFANCKASPSLDAECASRGMTPLQVYKEHQSQWKAGEGRLWVYRVEKSTTKSKSEPSEVLQSNAESEPEAESVEQ